MSDPGGDSGRKTKIGMTWNSLARPICPMVMNGTTLFQDFRPPSGNELGRIRQISRDPRLTFTGWF